MANSHSQPAQHSRRSEARRSSRSRGFTLVEILVALAVFMVMLAIIFVPLNLGFNAFNAGNTRAQVQQSANTTISQMERELRVAVYVYPNDAVPGVSSETPFTRIARAYPAPTPSVPFDLPYMQQAGGTNSGACGASTGAVVPVSNTARIDFIPPKRDSSGNIITPLQPADYIVTYYARRLQVVDTNGNDVPYDPIDNPIVMFRAQTPYRYADGSDFKDGTLLHLNTDSSRYPNDSNDYMTGGACDASNAANTDNGSRWLIQSSAGEPNLEPLTNSDAVNGAGTVAGSHTLLTPRGMNLVLRDSAAQPSSANQPTTAFSCTDTNDDGKIDRVTIRLVLGRDTGDGQTRNGQAIIQSQGLPQVVDLPNVH